MSYDEELNQIREVFRQGFELLRDPGKLPNNDFFNGLLNQARKQMRALLARFPKLGATSANEFSEERLNQLMEELRALDAKMVAAQKAAREELTPHKEYLIKESLDGTLFDGLDFQELIEADTIRKRMIWAHQNAPGMEGLF